jgi:ectoine hydroxylase-related dioxygenase (phytanoyl-CoA dioxygenase family)
MQAVVAKEVMLSREEFEQQGYVIVRKFFSAEEMKTLLEDIKSASPESQDLLNSGTLNFHANIYKCSQKIQRFVSQPRVVNLLQQLIGPNFWIRWDQAVAKGPGAGVFPWHQDNRYSRLQSTHYQFWIALTEMNRDNGGLWLQPSNCKRTLPHKKVGNHVEYKGTPDSPVLIDAEPGDVVIFSSFTLHSTTPNITQQTRWAYVVEYLATKDFDPTIDPPFFVVARNGKSHPEFVNFSGHRLNPVNQLKYAWLRLVPRKWFRSVLDNLSKN